jgi:hypothetical protein
VARSTLDLFPARPTPWLAALLAVIPGCAEGDYDHELPVASFGGVQDAEEPDAQAFVAEPDVGAAEGETDVGEPLDTDASGSGASESSTGDPQPPIGCCAPRDRPLCDDIDVFACVCKEDPSCCVNRWDETCVAEVSELGCGQC